MPRLLTTLSLLLGLAALMGPALFAHNNVLDESIEPTPLDSAELSGSNPTEWPFGGKIATCPKKDWMKNKPLLFTETVNFLNAEFIGIADFAGATFERNVNVGDAKFNAKADFRYAEFDGEFNSISTVYHDVADFEAVEFKVHANFKHAVFYKSPNFAWTSMPPKMSFENAEFREALDLRLADFDNVRSIFLESVDIESGKFLIEWEQLKAINDTFRINVKLDSVLYELGPSKLDDFNRLRNIYLALRNNFLAQDDGNAAADDVMYELALRKNKLIGGFWLSIYGTFFGYGYQPWRFLLFIVFPIIFIFAAFWYFAYYRLVGPKVLDNFDTLVKSQETEPSDADSGSAAKNTKTSLLTNTAWQRPDSAIRAAIPGLARLWHVLFFSATVLVGLRFSKDWLSTSNDKFNYWVTAQWLLGVCLYISFGVFVQGSKFDYVKELLGF